MTFQPVLPLSGYAGWRFLSRTLEVQQQAFDRSPANLRATEYFSARIGSVRTPDDLLADRRLLEVALGAFGLDADIGNTAFLRRVLADGTLKPDALANRLVDKRYAEFSRVFGFGDLGARTGLRGFAEDIVGRYRTKQFEKAVGQQNDGFRLALNLTGGIAEVVRSKSTERGRWFAVMGNPPLRRVFEGALGLPASFGRLDLDQQLETFRARSKATFGTDRIADFAQPEKREALIRLFLLRSEASGSASLSAGATALTLLQARP